MSSNNENGHNGPLTITMSRESYDVIMETLSMDLDSSYIDEEIKEDIEKAVNDTRIISLVSDTVHPESMPTCDGCGGQKEHPTKEFSYPPENGLCANELDECEPDLFDEMSQHYGEHGLPVKCNEDIHGNNIEDLGDYLEGDECPHCGVEGPCEPDNTDSDVYTIYHNYQCGDCGGKWFLKISHEAFKVVNK